MFSELPPYFSQLKKIKLYCGRKINIENIKQNENIGYLE